MGLSYEQAKALGIGHLHPDAGGTPGRYPAGHLGVSSTHRPAEGEPARPRRPRPADGMNKTERRFARKLDGLKAAGAILDWDFEPVKFRLADRTWLKIDFRLLLPDGMAMFVEVKARKKDGSVLWTDDGAVKIKTVAELHPFAFFLASYGDGGWRVERMPSRRWGFIDVELTWDI